MRHLSDEAKRKQYESQRRIHKETLDQITVWVKKGERAKYRELANSKGMSLNALIVGLLEEELNK